MGVKGTNHGKTALESLFCEPVEPWSVRSALPVTVILNYAQKSYRTP